MPKKTLVPDKAEATPPLKRTCGTMQVHERLLRMVPGYREARDLSENHALRATASPLMGRSGCTKIPVVVHVVYQTPAQNISDDQIESQIDVLNDDYRKKNGDISTVPAAFAPLAGDARIVFELATTDPAGNPTTGITRTTTTVASFSDDDTVKSSATGGADPWPSTAYLNIWVCQLGGGLLGYAQFPGGPAATDGVVILHSAFGTTGTATAPFDLGRTATHEVGHWLNLRHIWGDDGTGCAGSDFVADTPNQGGPNYGTPTFPSVSCSNGPNGDMFMNYMDYVDDAAMVMFSAGQVTRIQATLDGLRSSIGTAVPCITTQVPKNPKEFAKDMPKDWPKDPLEDWPKGLPKDFSKESPKEFIKELPKDSPKELIKEPPKEWPKDVAKEPSKDLPKDSGFDPPKSHFETPKSFFEPPINFPWTSVQPVQAPAGGGMPFVLATGATAGAQPPQAQLMRQQTAALAAAYLRLLAQYGKLHASGQLDAAGVAAWHETTAEYLRLVAASGQT